MRPFQWRKIRLMYLRWFLLFFFYFSSVCTSSCVSLALPPLVDPPLPLNMNCCSVVWGHRFIDAFITIVLEFVQLCVNCIWMRIAESTLTFEALRFIWCSAVSVCYFCCCYYYCCCCCYCESWNTVWLICNSKVEHNQESLMTKKNVKSHSSHFFQ